MESLHEHIVTCLGVLPAVIDEVLYSPLLTTAPLYDEVVIAVFTLRDLQTSLCFSVLDGSILGTKYNASENPSPLILMAFKHLPA